MDRLVLFPLRYDPVHLLHDLVLSLLIHLALQSRQHLSFAFTLEGHLLAMS